MIKKSAICCVMFFIYLVLLLFPFAVSAEDGKASVSLWVPVSPFISGDAGSGTGAPEYKDAFSTGIGVGGEFAWRFCRWFSGVGGLAYEVFDGKTYQGISIDNLKVMPLYVGGKFHLIPNAAPWDLYLRTDLGAAYLSPVDVSVDSLSGRYWNSSWVFLFDVGVGTEYLWGAWGVSLDVKVRYLGSPDSALGKPSEAGSFWTVPIVLGLNYHF
ncbi:MAG: hypothetical protein JRF65_08195 [Deltaproteobacteria bacterium]|nr:hypothetical protein [Deltaproteobacteria bacterium]